MTKLMAVENGSIVPDSPINLPGSPFWNVFRRFGRDEMVAMIVNVCGTAVASYFLTSTFVLAFVGPIVEKIGFFPAHIYEAVKMYRSTQPHFRKKFGYYFKQALKNGSVSLVEDVLVHDPLYVLLFIGLAFWPGIPVWLVASFSFLVAVVAVCWIEIMVAESRYALMMRKFVKNGFGKESYFESRFVIVGGNNISVITEKLSKVFGFSNNGTLHYNDIYFETDLPQICGRKPLVRLRTRDSVHSDTPGMAKFSWLKEHKKMQSLQVVYTRPREAFLGVDQFRFFPIAKDKLYFILNREMPEKVEDVAAGMKELMASGKELKRVSFRRSVFKDTSGQLALMIDVPDGDNCCIIELKIRKDLPHMLRIMRFIMREFPAAQTTFSKSELSIS